MLYCFIVMTFLSHPRYKGSKYIAYDKHIYRKNYTTLPEFVQNYAIHKNALSKRPRALFLSIFKVY